MNGRTARSRAFFALSLIASAALAIFCLHVFDLMTTVQPEETVYLADLPDWRVYVVEDGEKRPLQRMENGQYEGIAYDGQVFYLEGELDERLTPSVLQIFLGEYHVSVFLDGVLFYTNAPGSGDTIGGVDYPDTFLSEFVSTYVTLPADCVGKTLTIAQRNFDHLLACPFDLTFYTGTSLRASAAAPAARSVLPMFLLSLLTFSMLALFLLTLYRGRADAGLLFLSLFALCWLFNACARSALFLDRFGGVHNLLQQAFDYLSDAFMLLFLLSRMRRFRLVLVPFILLYLLSIPISLLVQAGYLIPYGDFYVSILFLPRTMEFLAVAAVCALTWPEARAQNGFYRTFGKTLLVAVVAYACLFVAAWAADLPYYRDMSQRLVSSVVDLHFIYPLYLFRIFSACACVAITLHQLALQLVKHEAQARTTSLRAQLSQSNLDNLTRSMQQTMALRRRLQLHISSLSALLAKGDTAQAIAYTRELAEEIDGLSVYQTGNTLVDMVLGDRLGAAGASGIRVEVKKASAPENLPILDSDLCLILLNLLDNALSALRSCEQPERMIVLQLWTQEDSFHFVCENSADHPTLPNAAARRHPDGRESGLAIVERTLLQYGGKLDLKVREASVRAEAILPLHS